MEAIWLPLGNSKKLKRQAILLGQKKPLQNSLFLSYAVYFLQETPCQRKQNDHKTRFILGDMYESKFIYRKQNNATR